MGNAGTFPITRQYIIAGNAIIFYLFIQKAKLWKKMIALDAVCRGI